MNSYGEYCLKPGTVLDTRYRIDRVIGAGGFGITYEAVNERIGLRVAIKEFFCREIVYRDASVSSKVILTDAAVGDEFEDAKKKFLREARLVGDFSDQPGVVKVLDYFEENDTAYMVMNYLDGVTLDKYLSEHGKFQVEELVKLFLPLMETLGKIHGCGIIHRDISPDNIMFMQDGSMRLLDFGAARDYLLKMNRTRSVVLKAGYAPCEQYDIYGNQGPWTDVYALCATMYECLTGQRPMASVSRAIQDELKMPSELGVKTDAGFEKILKKGLRVRSEDRYQNMQELIDALKAWLPEKSAPSGSKKAVVITAAVCATICIAAGGAWYYRTHMEEFLFRGIETETIVLVPDVNMTAREYNAAVETVEQRLETYVGKGNYVCKEENGKIRVVMPLSVFGEENLSYEVEEQVKKYLAAPLQLSIGTPMVEENNYTAKYNCFEREDVISMEVKDGTIPVDCPAEWSEYDRYVEFSVSEAALEDLKAEISEAASVTGNELRLYVDPATSYMKTYALVVNDDWDTFYLPVAEGWELWKLYLECPEISKAFEIYCEIPVEWEEESIFWGENQCVESDIALPAVCVEYGAAMDDYVADEKMLDDGLWIEAAVNLKARLDALEIPYAFGVSPDDRRRPVLMMAQKDWNGFLTKALEGTEYSFALYDGEKTLDLYGYEIQIVENGDDTYTLRWIMEDYSVEDLQEKTSLVLENGGKELCLMFQGFVIAKTELSQPVCDGVIDFSRCMIGDSAQFTKEQLSFLDFIEAVFKNQSEILYHEKRVQYLSADCLVETEPETEDSRLMPQNREFAEIREWIEEEYPEAETQEQRTTSVQTLALQVTLHQSADPEEFSGALDVIREIFTECSLQESLYYKVSFYLDAYNEYPCVYFSKDIESGEWKLFLNVMDTDAADTLVELLRADEFFASFSMEQ